MTNIPVVYIIAGPTAVGKTAIAINLAQWLNTSIISADSRQCYREMSIGTAKPSAEELAAVPHYFVNELPVSTHFTAADFEFMALKHLAGLFTHNNTAVVAGGTGLYIKALCDGLDDMPPVADSVIGAIETQYDINGLEWLQQTVQQEDPEFYSVGEVSNPARLLRALSFKRATGSSITQYRTNSKKQRPFRIIKVGLELPREVLYQRINERVDKMMDNGLLAEVELLYPLRHLKNLQTVGYTELFDYIEGKYDLHTAIDKIKQHTRNYAKRQLTWFKKDKDFIWLDATDKNVVQKILSIAG